MPEMIIRTLNKQSNLSVCVYECIIPGLRLPREESVLNVAPVLLFLEAWPCAWPL